MKKTILFISLILSLFFSCKTTSTTIVDKSEIIDSSYVKSEVIQDSIKINKEETKTEENEQKEVVTEDVKITFGEGGGSYNTTTGEAHNVQSVTSNKQSETLKKELLVWENKYEELNNKYQLALDSLSNINKQMDLESEVEETYQSAWYWWLAIGALLMFIAIVAIRKIPAVSWLLFWI